jgi:hypothetical protein
MAQLEKARARQPLATDTINVGYGNFGDMRKHVALWLWKREEEDKPSTEYTLRIPFNELPSVIQEMQRYYEEYKDEK